jgi:FKBP-type peptidyl-prolyl cis-trans isomerase SlyD
MQVQDNAVVRIDYTLRDDAGEVLETSEGREPMAYMHGVGQMLPGLERAMAGKAAGDALNVTVAPEEGYGEHNAELVQSVPRDVFEGVEKIEPGMRFTAQTAAGPCPVTVTEVGEEQVKIDANHPLAGHTLHFDVTVVEVREATAEELEHGHPH